MTPSPTPDTPLQKYVLLPLAEVVVWWGMVLWYVGAPLGALYLVVRFVKWAWLQ